MTQIPQQAPMSVKPSILNINPLLWLKKYQPWMISVSIILALVWLIKSLFFSPTAISVVGIGELSVVPAAVEMVVTRVDSSGDTVKAINQSEDSLNTIVSIAKEIAGSDIGLQKSFYQVTPVAVAGDVMYQVVTAVKITANDPAKASDLIKALYSAGATSISNVNFIPADQDDVTQDARKAAMKDAKVQARAVARAAGKRVGRMASISDDQIDASGTLSTENQMPSADLSATPNQIDITKSVTVTYYLW